jgi:hypothetical protein
VSRTEDKCVIDAKYVRLGELFCKQIVDQSEAERREEAEIKNVLVPLLGEDALHDLCVSKSEVRSKSRK